MENYCCEICNYKTCKKYNLNRHMKKHSKDKKNLRKNVYVEKRIKRDMDIIST